MDKSSKTKTVFLDIETYYSEDKVKLEDVKVPANYKKEEIIQKYKEDNLDKAWMKTALDPLQGRIYCVGVAVNDGEVNVLHGKNEKDTLEMLENYLSELSYFKVVAHNGNDFDYPFLFFRAIKHGNVSIRNTFSGKDGTQLLDSMRIADGTSWKTMKSLDKLCKLIGIKGKGDITGDMVPKLILEGRGEEVIPYCGEDIANLRKVYLALGETI